MERIAFRRGLARLERIGNQAPDLPVERLRGLRTRMRQLRQELDRTLHVAEHRLAQPLIGPAPIRRQPGTEWAWRHPMWEGPIPVPGLAQVETRTPLSDGATVFHDCRRSELTLRQIRNTRAADSAPFGLQMDVFRFDGSFLSLVLDLPPEAVQGLKLRHVIRLDAIIEVEKPLEIFARLNIKHGPNVEQIVRELPLQEPEVVVEFDLAYTKINEKRVDKLWVDLIFEGPEMNQVILRDVTVSRRPRAEL